MKIAADVAKNALLIEATPADYRRLMRVIGELDVIPNQVLIEATIAEVSLNDELKMGVRWFFKSKKSESFTFTDAASGAVSSVFPGFSYALTAANLSMTLNALNTDHRRQGHFLPSLTVMDNGTAVLQIGDQVPITTASTDWRARRGHRQFGELPRHRRDPRHHAAGSTPAGSCCWRSSRRSRPSPRRRPRPSIHPPSSSASIKTSVFVKDGQALALGGMIQTSNSSSRGQVPILGDIPLLGTRVQEQGQRDGQDGAHRRHHAACDPQFR